MREIKFRAWNKKTKEWEFAEAMPVFSISIAEDLMKDLEIIQFTGLKDKNGKEIYEGYIVKTICRKYEVVFEVSEFALKNVNTRQTSLKRLYEYQDMEIIGNKFENPELLK